MQSGLQNIGLRCVPLRTLLVAFLFICFLEAAGRDQSSSGRIVSIPATVTNKNGDYVTGLQASIFSLSEGGHDSKLESVKEVSPVVVGPDKTRVPFVVLDALGSRDQSETRMECLQLLADYASKNLPVSLAEIDSDGLHEVSGVVISNSILLSALLQLDDESHFLTRRNQFHPTAISDDKSLIAAEAERLRQFRRGSVQRVNMMGTIQAQLNSLRQLAIALQQAKGRKTVIWLTGYFPVEVNENEDSLNINSFRTGSGFPLQAASIEFQKTIDLLNDAQISIFPVELNSGGAGSNLPGPVAGDRTLIGLRLVAKSTGGEEMAFSKELDRLVQSALDKSMTYYLLSFQPEVSRNLRWKSLKVETIDKSLRVKSPDGLFLFPQK
ncbi:MAG TPA: VWA domain-containing protein [Terriglobales bacterium]|nr:VWA domain-containing protein [Terriglobales bacterium]